MLKLIRSQNLKYAKFKQHLTQNVQERFKLKQIKKLFEFQKTCKDFLREARNESKSRTPQRSELYSRKTCAIGILVNKATEFN